MTTTDLPSNPIDAAALLGTHDVLLVTLDTLRYDVAAEALAAGRTPHLAGVLPGGAWERRHSPATFTYAAHHAFFAGFLPTPQGPGRHERLFAARFAGSETSGPGTAVLDAPDVVTGLAALGYHTVCVGGVGFFNKQTPLGGVLPGLFAESHWEPELGVTGPRSTELQVKLAARILEGLPPGRRVLLFVNVSALHQPNCLFTPGATTDTTQTQAAALAYVDSWLPVLFDAVRRRGPALAIVCSDHGTAYGEDGYVGHRLAHPVVWTVPYAQFILRPQVPSVRPRRMKSVQSTCHPERSEGSPLIGRRLETLRCAQGDGLAPSARLPSSPDDASETRRRATAAGGDH